MQKIIISLLGLALSASAVFAAVYPDGTLLRTEGDSRVFYIQNAQKRWVVSPEAFNVNGFNWSQIRPVSKMELDSYQTGEDITGSLTGATVTLEITPAFAPSDAPQGVDFSLLWNAWKTVEEKYKNSTTLDRQKMVEGAVDGMIRSLGDPYTTFLKSDDATKFTEDVAGEFYGIGAELGYKNGIVVIAPLKGLAAEKAGVKAGDKILRINDESTLDLTVEQAVIRIRGPKGVSVRLTIERAGEAAMREISIVRELVRVPTIEWTKKTNDIAYVRILNFFGDVEKDFINAVKEVQAGGMRKIILDVRGNPGGLLDASISIASQFIPKGSVVVSADFGEGKGKSDFNSTGGILEKTPVVVLMNSGSASASEILAGALKDARNATLVGERTFGKGTIQELLRLPGGGLMKITTAQWLRPSGKPIDEHGIDPDNEVLLTDEDKTAGRDPQLDQALRVIQAIPF